MSEPVPHPTAYATALLAFEAQVRRMEATDPSGWATVATRAAMERIRQCGEETATGQTLLDLASVCRGAAAHHRSLGQTIEADALDAASAALVDRGERGSLTCASLGQGLTRQCDRNRAGSGRWPSHLGPEPPNARDLPRCTACRSKDVLHG